MGTSKRWSLGLRFGLAGVTASVVDLVSGRTLGVGHGAYARGEMRGVLAVGRGVKLPAGMALIDAREYLPSAVRAVAGALKSSKGTGASVVSVGVAASSCVLLPVTGDGDPLCGRRGFERNPHAYGKSVHHVLSQAAADRINQIAALRGEGWPKRFGGSVPASWFLPKALELLETASEVYRASDVLMEAGEWVVWQLTGVLHRSGCHGGFKQCWSRRHGYPSREFLGNLHPEFANVVDRKLAGARVGAGQTAGTLTGAMAKRLGLRAGVPVSSSMIDTHAAGVGAGLDGGEQLCILMEESATHLYTSRVEQFLGGVCGVVEDGVVPGLYGYEAQQPGFGASLRWFGGLLASVGGSGVGKGVAGRAAAGLVEKVLVRLEKQAEQAGAGAGGLLGLDWLSGSRSPVADGRLTGVLAGLTAKTSAGEVYRCLQESLGCGARAIVEMLEGGGLEVGSVTVCGSWSARSPGLVGVMCDVLGRPVRVAGTSSVESDGAAILAALGAGEFSGIEQAQRKLGGGRSYRTVKPRAGHAEVYRGLMEEYRRLTGLLGRYEVPTLKNLRGLVQG